MGLIELGSFGGMSWTFKAILRGLGRVHLRPLTDLHRVYRAYTSGRLHEARGGNDALFPVSHSTIGVALLQPSCMDFV